MTYSSACDELVKRILALPKDKVEACKSPFDLFKIEGFKCDDLEPSFAQAAWAFGFAKQTLKGGSK